MHTQGPRGVKTSEGNKQKHMLFGSEGILWVTLPKVGNSPKQRVFVRAFQNQGNIYHTIWWKHDRNFTPQSLGLRVLSCPFRLKRRPFGVFTPRSWTWSWLCWCMWSVLWLPCNRSTNRTATWRVWRGLLGVPWVAVKSGGFELQKWWFHGGLATKIWWFHAI